MKNRLENETSPYLKQHEENPVDWFPWGEEAFARAVSEDKPVFLSIGYSSCHWCHVMAHESFEDPAVAAILNEKFVSIKVDREERPDIDETYMAAVQLTSGRGGWPMSVFMTPDGRPFFAGTYFPKEDRGEFPGFASVCQQLSKAWETRRPDLERAADQISDALRETLGRPAPESTVTFDQTFIDKSVTAILQDFDPDFGGFGSAPKFPPHTCIQFLMNYAMGTNGPQELREAAIEAALITLQKMVFGGIHDHVGGGFHRYSTDAKWLLPHFEKMLYDNALMLGNLAHASAIADAVAPELGERLRVAAAGIVDWASREMLSSEGLFYSAIDADSEGEEGKFYVWDESEVRMALGSRSSAFLKAFGFEPSGNFADEATGKRTGANIPYLIAETGGEYDSDLETLLEARSRRERPMTDTKAITSWNGLMISSLVEVGLVPLASVTAEAILQAEEMFGRLPHQIVDGVPSGDGFLDDYAFFADALFRLSAVAEAFEAEGEAFQLPRPWTEYRTQGSRLGREMIEGFYDNEKGGFFFSGDRHEALFGRSKPAFDQPVTSPNAGALRVLIELGEEEMARKTLSSMLGWMERAPQATEGLFDAALPILGFAAGGVELPVQIEAPIVASPVQSVPKEPVQVHVSTREIIAGPDGFGSAEVRISIPTGSHLNSNEPPARWLVPTKVDIKPVTSEIDYPPSINDRFEGEMTIPFRVKLPTGKQDAEFEIRVSYQICTESECEPPSERVFDAVVIRG